MKRKFWLLWTYSANYAEKAIEVEAEMPEAAVKDGFPFYSDDFKKRATIYVFESPPVLVSKPGSR